jgi:hypothetical protein
VAYFVTALHIQRQLKIQDALDNTASFLKVNRAQIARYAQQFEKLAVEKADGTEAAEPVTQSMPGGKEKLDG